MCTKKYLDAFGYKANLRTVFETPKNVIIKYNGNEELIHNSLSIAFVENDLYSMVIIEYKQDEIKTFETSSKNVEEIIILD